MYCRTVIDQAHVTSDGTYVILLKSLGKFLLMFGCSALIGAALAICSALVGVVFYCTALLHLI